MHVGRRRNSVFLAVGAKLGTTFECYARRSLFGKSYCLKVVIHKGENISERCRKPHENPDLDLWKMVCSVNNLEPITDKYYSSCFLSATRRIKAVNVYLMILYHPL